MRGPKGTSKGFIYLGGGLFFGLQAGEGEEAGSNERTVLGGGGIGRDATVSATQAAGLQSDLMSPLAEMPPNSPVTPGRPTPLGSALPCALAREEAPPNKRRDPVLRDLEKGACTELPPGGFPCR